MRTFVAFDLPETIRGKIAELVDVFRSSCHSNVNWVAKENLHITFQFIGETKAEDINGITELLDESFKGFSKLMFRKPKLEIIPGKNPKIIWVYLENHESLLQKTSKKLKSKLRKMGYKIDSRRLLFHITLGRIKKRLPDKVIKQILTTELKINCIEVSKATLYKSLLKPQGPRYFDIINYNF